MSMFTRWPICCQQSADYDVDDEEDDAPNDGSEHELERRVLRLAVGFEDEDVEREQIVLDVTSLRTILDVKARLAARWCESGASPAAEDDLTRRLLVQCVDEDMDALVCLPGRTPLAALVSVESLVVTLKAPRYPRPERADSVHSRTSDAAPRPPVPVGCGSTRAKSRVTCLL